MKLGGVFILFAGLHGAICAQALTSTTVLPAGINSPSFRMGNIQGLDQKYTEDGTLMRLGDYKSVAFDAPQLAKFNPDAKKLIDALNRFGSQRLGDNFNLGVLRVEATPQVKYFAPVYARGVSSRWTLGFGLPVVNYTNKIHLSQQFSNTEYYRQQFAGLDPELDKAFNTDLGQATNQTLAGKGYKTLSNRDETFMADIQLVSVYRIYEDADQALSYQAQVGLPTGPKYNADDLAAINIFGRTSINNTFAYSHQLGTRFTAVPFVSYLVNIQDSVEMRVPTTENDTLPDQSTKENVQRQIGNVGTLGGNLVYNVSDSISFGTGYEISQKEQDTYRGGRNQRYDLLAKNSDMKAQRVRAEITYSSVKSYFKKAAAIPAMVSLEVSDVIAGINIERQLIQELNVMLFF